MDALSCLAPPNAALLPCADFITRALHFSTMPDTSSSSSSSSSAAFLADFSAAYGGAGGGGFALSAPPPTMPAITARPSPAGRRPQQQLGPAGGRAGKRRPRASKRAPTTYISTDPANFRLMVQHVTGVQAADPSIADIQIPTTTAPFDGAASNLLDTSTAPPPHDVVAAAAFATHPMLLQAEHYQQQPCFPTLDSSWSAVMYDATDHLL